VRRVRITVHKPEAPVGVPFDDVTVTIVRPV
jgi:dihydroneopterin aldolase